MRVYGNKAKLKVARIRAGLYQRDVAASAGITVSSYAQIESGKKSTTGKTAKQICECLHVMFDDAFCVEEV